MAVRIERFRRLGGSALVALVVSAAVAQDAATLEDQGKAALRAGDAAAAVVAFRAALDERPDDPGLLFDLGRSYSALKDWDAAIATYRRVLELRPGDARTLNNLANVYFRQGRYDEAATWYRRAVAVRPDYLLAQFHLGWVTRQLNQTEAARAAFRACLQIPASDDRERRTQLDCHFYLGTLAYREGDAATTAQVMEDVLRVYPYHPEARHYLAMAYRRLGRDDEAREQFEIHRQFLKSNRSQPIEAGTDAP